MKSLLVTEVFPPRTGGSGRWFWEVYRRLPRGSYVVAAGEHPRQDEFDRTHDLRLLRLPLTFSTWGVASRAGLRQYVGMARSLLRLARAEGAGMLHCGKALPEGFLAWMLKRWCGLPYLCYVHGEELNLAAASRELAWLTRRALHGAAFVIANSRNTEALLRGNWGLPPERVRVLHPGVDASYFVPAPRDPGSRARIGWGERPVVLTVGRLQKRKGHDMMIRALAEVRRSVPEVLYAIVGDGEEREALETLVDAGGLRQHVQFLGELDDAGLLICYQQCDLFVLPNRQVGQDIEGFGMVLVEAQACGRPVVAGASGGTAETLRVPATGRLAAAEEPLALAEVVADLLRQPELREQMGRAARRWAAERFDWSALTRQGRQLFAGGVAPAADSARPERGDASRHGSAATRKVAL
jgi:phosphatidylinositol alpha-1,6-mannosyltransferase